MEYRSSTYATTLRVTRRLGESGDDCVCVCWWGWIKGWPLHTQAPPRAQPCTETHFSPLRSLDTDTETDTSWDTSRARAGTAVGTKPGGGGHAAPRHNQGQQRDHNPDTGRRPAGTSPGPGRGPEEELPDFSVSATAQGLYAGRLKDRSPAVAKVLRRVLRMTGPDGAQGRRRALQPLQCRLDPIEWRCSSVAPCSKSARGPVGAAGGVQTSVVLAPVAILLPKQELPGQFGPNFANCWPILADIRPNLADVRGRFVNMAPNWLGEK